MIVYILKMLQTQNCIWYHSCSDSYNKDVHFRDRWNFHDCFMTLKNLYNVIFFSISDLYFLLLLFDNLWTILFNCFWFFFLLLLLKCFMNNIPFSYLYHRKLLLLILFVHTCIYFNHKLTENSVYILSNWQPSNIKF